MGNAMARSRHFLNLGSAHIGGKSLVDELLQRRRLRTADQIADKLQEFGVLVLGKPFTGAQFRQAVQLAASNYKRLAVLRAENAKLLDKIAQLRLVDRAKCYLIEKKHYTETEAHRLIEKMAMDTRRPRGEIAQEILEEDDEE